MQRANVIGLSYESLGLGFHVLSDRSPSFQFVDKSEGLYECVCDKYFGEKARR